MAICHSQELNDLSPMPFGKHKGTPMQDVSTRYLHWLWHNGLNKEPENLVSNYIKRNLHALKLEDQDLLW